MPCSWQQNPSDTIEKVKPLQNGLPFAHYKSVKSMQSIFYIFRPFLGQKILLRAGLLSSIIKVIRLLVVRVPRIPRKSLKIVGKIVKVPASLK